MVEAIGKPIVYGTEETADQFYIKFNIGTVISAVTNPYVTISATIPVTIYFLMEILRGEWILASNWFTVTVNIIIITILLVFLAINLFRSALSFGLFDQKTRRYKDWSQEIAVVTGGSSGIGLELTKRLTQMGCKVAVLDVQQLPTMINNATFYKCDVSDFEKVSMIVEKIEAEIGPITILVNNAGIVNGKSLEELSPERIRKVFDVNTLAQFWTTKCVLPKFKTRLYGHIVTIASTMGLAAVADMTDYCASKYASIGFHEALRQEIRRLSYPNLLHSTLVCPGLILTGMFNGIKMPFPFIVPPLLPSQVVDQIVSSLNDCVGVDPSSPQNQDLSSILKEKKFTISEKFKQHKTIWIPLSYYLPPLMNIILPVYLNDMLKSLMGGNDAVQNTFIGRQKSN